MAQCEGTVSENKDRAVHVFLTAENVPPIGIH